ncbi:hypothetical protein, partial [Corynebacterium flavescens]|uniref:hypothetical protein n=1 Tax=Corynebacterium flavescens TaxID=28028 RepID=UPI0023F5000C
TKDLTHSDYAAADIVIALQPSFAGRSKSGYVKQRGTALPARYSGSAPTEGYWQVGANLCLGCCSEFLDIVGEKVRSRI